MATAKYTNEHACPLRPLARALRNTTSSQASMGNGGWEITHSAALAVDFGFRSHDR